MVKTILFMVIHMVSIPLRLGRLGKIGLGILVAGIALLVYYITVKALSMAHALGLLTQLNIPIMFGTVALICAGIAIMVIERIKGKVEQVKK